MMPSPYICIASPAVASAKAGPAYAEAKAGKD